MPCPRTIKLAHPSDPRNLRMHSADPTRLHFTECIALDEPLFSHISAENERALARWPESLPANKPSRSTWIGKTCRSLSLQARIVMIPQASSRSLSTFSPGNTTPVLERSNLPRLTKG